MLIILCKAKNQVKLRNFMQKFSVRLNHAKKTGAMHDKSPRYSFIVDASFNKFQRILLGIDLLSSGTPTECKVKLANTCASQLLIFCSPWLIKLRLTLARDELSRIVSLYNTNLE